MKEKREQFRGSQRQIYEPGDEPELNTNVDRKAPLGESSLRADRAERVHAKQRAHFGS